MAVSTQANALSDYTGRVAVVTERDGKTVISADAQVMWKDPSYGAQSANVSKVTEKKLPRPANSFILYRKSLHPELKAANPGMHNNDICMSPILTLLSMLISNSEGRWRRLAERG